MKCFFAFALIACSSVSMASEQIYCFNRSKVESLTTFHAHDELETSNDFLYYGVLTEGTKKGSPVVYVKAKPLTPVGRVLEIAFASKRTFASCFQKQLFDLLSKEFDPKKTSPRYEHQVAVELTGVEM